MFVLLPVLATLLLTSQQHGGGNILEQQQPRTTDEAVLWDWLQDVDHHVLIQDDGRAGRGLVASRRLEPGQVVVSVPPHLTIRVEGDESANENDDWAGVLAARLMTSRTYREYGLPQTPPSIPARWTLQQQLELQNATLLEEIQQVNAWRHYQADRHCASQQEQSDFLYCLDLVCSRTLRGNDGSRQLVPLLDMANHAATEQGGGQFRVLPDGTVQLLVGNRGVHPGQAITLDYGARIVDDFLLHYGFVPDRCYSDAVTVPAIDGSKSDLALSWKDCQGYRGHADAAVREAARNVLVAFPTSLQDDVELLNGEDSSNIDHATLSYRYAKKSLLSSLAGLHSWS